MRAALPIALAAVLIVGLTGCTGTSDDSGSDDTASDNCPAAPSGKASDSVKVSGEDGAEPTVTFDSPISAKSTQRTVITKGDGDDVEEGSLIEVAYSVSNAETGDVLEVTGYDKAQPLPVEEAGLLPGLYKEVVCSTVGSRLAAVVPPGDAFGDDGANFGLGDGDNLVIVADIISKLPTRAVGEAQGPVAGFPTLELAKDGEPTATVPTDLAFGSTTTSSVTIAGAGEALTADSTIVAQYVGLTSDGKVFDSSWANKSLLNRPLSGLVPGWAVGLAGKTVGSQVILEIPDAEGYGGTGNDLDGQNLIFVVDILAAY